MSYNRLTPRDWHDAKFKQLDQRAVLKRLWDLENQLEESTKPHYYVTTGQPKKDFIRTDNGQILECVYTETYVVYEGIPSIVAKHFGVYDNRPDAAARAAALNQHPYRYSVKYVKEYE